LNIEQRKKPKKSISSSGEFPQTRVLIVTAVSAEKDAIMQALHNDPRFEVLVGGVGSVVAAVNTTRALAEAEYSLVISAGIGGGFPSKAEVGSLVVGTEIIAADLGAETPDGFNDLETLGFGFTRIQSDSTLVERITKALLEAQLPVHAGPVLTVSTVTGTIETARELTARIKGASAEAMEGFGVGCAAINRGLPVLEIRAISNLVGPRDRSAWRIKDALGILEAACEVLVEVL